MCDIKVADDMHRLATWRRKTHQEVSTEIHIDFGKDLGSHKPWNLGSNKSLTKSYDDLIIIS